MIAQVVSMLVFLALVTADVWLTIQIVAKGGTEVGIISSKVIGTKPTPIKTVLFAVVTTIPYVVLIPLCWRAPDMVIAGWALLAWAVFFRVKAVVGNVAVLKGMKA
jgi:hypothetical protein